MKKFIVPILVFVPFIVAVVGLFLTAWQFVIIGNPTADFSFFADWNDAFSTIASHFAGFESVWAVVTMISALVGLASLLIFILLKLLQALKIIKRSESFSKLFAWLALIAFLAVFAFGLVFTLTNSETGTFGLTGMAFGIGYWLTFAGVGLGSIIAVISSFSKIKRKRK